MKKMLIFGLLAVGFISCNKKKECYDAELAEAYTVIDCTADCPGFKACNGETYCNECVAATNGFGPE